MKHGLRLRVVALLALAACGDSGTEPDLPPSVVSRTPERSATSVDVLTPIDVTFSQPLDSTGLEGAIVILSNGREAEGSVAQTSPTALRFSPSTPFDFGTEVEVRVSAQIRSRAGLALGAGESWSFTTEGAPPPDPDVAMLRSHVAVLASDSLRGRGSGTADELRAAQYILGRFDEYGLDPLDGVDMQAFEATNYRDGSPVHSQNVLGVVPGSGALASQWIVVGAHYDHVGIRETESGLEIHNGADDNASGTSAVMELGRLFSQYVDAGGMSDQPRRSVLFATWGAEEVGLRGSCAFAHSGLFWSTLPDAVLNFDMVGRLRNNTVALGGLDSSPEWAAIVSDSNVPDLAFGDTGVSATRTDVYCFLAAQTPSLWFYTLTHEDYHRPTDDADLLNYDGLSRITELSLRVLTRLAVRPGTMPFEN